MPDPKKNVAFTFPMSLVDSANRPQFKANPTLATGDFKVSIDDGAFNNLASLPTVAPASGRNVVVALSQSEMNGDRIVVQAVDAAGGEWDEAMVAILTTTNTVDDVYSRLGAPAGASVSADVAAVKAETAAILDDTGTSGVVLANDAITAAKIAANAITSSEIADGAITAAKFAAGAIDAAAIADNAIDAGAIAANAITSAKIAAGAITAAGIADGAIDAATFAAGAIDAAAIADGAIDAATFAAGAINAAAIADGAIDAATFAAGAIDAAAIADNAIDAGAIAANAITAAKIATGAIDADALAADAIDEIWDEVVEGTTTARQSMRLANTANGGKTAGMNTTTATLRDLADTKDRVTATVDANGNRSAVTLDLT